MPALTERTSNYLKSHAPPAIDTDLGWDLAVAFAGALKRDLNIREPWEVQGILRIWNNMHGSPFSGEQISLLATTTRAGAAKPCAKKGQHDDQQTPLFPQD